MRTFLALALLALSGPSAWACMCTGCGCKGGPGFRGPDGRCVSYKRLTTVCGQPATTNCTYENRQQACEHEGALPQNPQALVAAALLPAAVPSSNAASGKSAEPIEGRATVIDGDTIEIRSQRFRLQGIDAPESAQLCQGPTGAEYRCGQTAAMALADKIGTTPVACDPIEKDTYGRTVAICFLEEIDLNGWLVEQGLGMAYRQYSTAYVAQEEAAKAAKRGIWAGAFTPPWDWRHANPSGRRLETRSSE